MSHIQVIFPSYWITAAVFLLKLDKKNHPGTKVCISIDFGGSSGELVYRSLSAQIISTHIPLAKAIWTLSVVAGILEKLALNSTINKL